MSTWKVWVRGIKSSPRLEMIVQMASQSSSARGFMAVHKRCAHECTQFTVYIKPNTTMTLHYDIHTAGKAGTTLELVPLHPHAINTIPRPILGKKTSILQVFLKTGSSRCWSAPIPVSGLKADVCVAGLSWSSLRLLPHHFPWLVWSGPAEAWWEATRNWGLFSLVACPAWFLLSLCFRPKHFYKSFQLKDSIFSSYTLPIAQGLICKHYLGS